MTNTAMPEVGLYPGGNTIAELAANAARLDSAGFAGFWVGDSHHDAFVTAAAIAGATKHTTVGTAVALLTRTPAQTVVAATSLVDIAPDRVALGFGMGPQYRNVDWHGISWDKPAARMKDYVATVRACWSAGPGRSVTHEGPYYQVRNYNRVRPMDLPPIPLLVAVVGQYMCRVAGEVSDGVLLNNVHTVRWVEDKTRAWLAEGARRAGRDAAALRLGVVRYTAVHPDRATAYNRVRHNLAYSAQYPYNHPLIAYAGFERELEAIKAAWARNDVEAAANAISDDMVDAMAFAGTIDDVRRRLAAWSGVANFVVLAPAAYFLTSDEIADNAARIVEAFAK